MYHECPYKLITVLPENNFARCLLLEIPLRGLPFQIKFQGHERPVYYYWQ